jgi:ribosomal protein S18 acetylase RimI-like enzyme
MKALKCHRCQNDAIYKCRLCEHQLCAKHTEFTTICLEHKKKATLRYTIKEKASCDTAEIRRIVEKFWGEDKQLTHDQTFDVPNLSGYIAKTKEGLIGFVSIIEIDDDILIVALGVLPKHQSLGIGKALVKKVEDAAFRMKKKRLFVSTSNDDLPALAFYQSINFQIYEVKPNVIAMKHGKVISGIAGLPVRDELRLQKTVQGRRARTPQKD